MNDTLDDAVLVAYVDGELDARRRREVESWLRTDAGANAKARLMEDSARALRGAYDEVFDRPVPDRLRALLESARPRPAARAAEPWWRRLVDGVRSRGIGPVTAAAACVGALVLGVALGRVELGGGETTYLPASVAPAASSAMVEDQVRALETGADGVTLDYERTDLGVSGRFTPLASIEGPDGMACRGFRDEVIHAAMTVATVGIACRGADGTWTMLAVPAAPDD